MGEMAKGGCQERHAVARGPLPAVHRGGHVDVHPRPWEVKAQVSPDEQTGTGALRIAPILEEGGGGVPTEVGVA